MNQRYGLEIRAATGTDAAGLSALMTAAGLSVPATEMAERLEALQREGGTVLIALEWGPPSGLVALHWRRTLLDARPVAQITTLLVAPDERRRGLGRLLLKAASRAARSAGCDLLRMCGSDDDETALRHFCSANGFVDASAGFVRPLRKRGAQPDA